MGLAVSALLVKCRSESVLKSTSIHPVYLLMQKHKVRRGLGWASSPAESREPQTCHVLQLEPQLPPSWYEQTGPWIKVQARTSTALWRRRFLSDRFTSPRLCDRGPCLTPSPQLVPIFLCQTGGSQTVPQQAGTLIFRAMMRSGKQFSSFR